MSANRRDLWWGLDLHGVGAERHKWNESLLTDVLAPAYCHLIEYIAQKYATLLISHSIIDQYYRLFPLQTNSKPFQQLMNKFYQNIKYKNILYSPLTNNMNDHGSWVSPLDCIAIHMNDNIIDKNMNHLQNILIKCEISVVNLDKVLMKSMIKYESGLQEYSPSWLRSCIKSVKMSAFLNINNHTISNEDRIFLLQLCLEDININNVSELNELPILPLTNGSFTNILCNNQISDDQRVFFTTDVKFIAILENAPMSVFQQQQQRIMKNNNSETNSDLMLSARVIAKDLPNAIQAKFSDSQLMQNTNITDTCAETLIHLLPSLLPKRYLTETEILWNDTLLSNNNMMMKMTIDDIHPTSTWIRHIWTYFKEEKKIMQQLSHICIFPIINHSFSENNDHKCQSLLVRPNTDQHIFIDVHQFDQPVRYIFICFSILYFEYDIYSEILSHIGFSCVENPFVVNNNGARMFVLDSSTVGIMRGIRTLADKFYDGMISHYCNKVFNSPFIKVSHRRSLRDYLQRDIENCKYSSDGKKLEMISKFKSVIKSLPIYDIYIVGESYSSDDGSFVDLFKNGLIWPPNNVDISSFINDQNTQLSIAFLKVEGGKSSLLTFLGIEQKTKSTFFDEYILPKMEEFSPTTRDAIVLNILRNLEQLSHSDPSFVEKLLKHPFLPTGPNSRLCRVEKVYVPSPKLRVLNIFIYIYDCDCD